MVDAEEYGRVQRDDNAHVDQTFGGRGDYARPTGDLLAPPGLVLLESLARH